MLQTRFTSVSTMNKHTQHHWHLCILGGFITLVLSGLVSAKEPATSERLAQKPNVVFIFADDLGYGEIEALDPEYAKIPTPNLNRLAAEGQIYTDAHTSSSVCTPSRYGLLTGRYAWRTRLQSSVLGDAEEPMIEEGRMTLGDLFREQGYQTAIFGKWHLGFTFEVPEGIQTPRRRQNPEGFLLAAVPIGSLIPDGPTTRGFDTWLGFHHARSMSSVIRDNRIIEEIPTVEMLPKLNREVADYIDRKAAESKQGKPFFLYFPQSSPHSPIVPSKEWQGKTGLGDYGDFVAQTDDSVGVVLEALERNGIRDNTIVIFSSDNGSSLHSSVPEIRTSGHRPSGGFRGKKGNLWDGGHRVPFVLSWPEKVKAGTQVNQVICLTDMMETFADLFSVELPDSAAEDSVSFLPTLYGEPVPNPRKTIVHHDIKGYFSIREGYWKLLLKKQAKAKVQLYDLQQDPGEKKTLARKYPEKVKQMISLLESLVSEGRSTSGDSQKNDAAISLWKDETAKNSEK